MVEEDYFSSRTVSQRSQADSELNRNTYRAICQRRRFVLHLASRYRFRRSSRRVSPPSCSDYGLRIMLVWSRLVAN